jgi:RNA polymerase sigma factor (sigma-70 family)
MSDVTRLLEAAHRGDRRAAADLLPLVYDELRKLAAARLAGERPGQTLSATALVHEAFLRLVGDGSRPASAEHPGSAPQVGPQFDGRGHFFAAAAEAIRRILVEQARRRQAAKRGGAVRREELDPDRITAPAPDDELLALHEALDRLSEQHPEKAELVKLRYFAGLTADQAADALGVSPSTADRHWAYARAWLKRAMSSDTPQA